MKPNTSKPYQCYWSPKSGFGTLDILAENWESESSYTYHSTEGICGRRDVLIGSGLTGRTLLCMANKIFNILFCLCSSVQKLV